MLNLLKFEFRKLFRSKAFWVCLGLSLGFILLSCIATKALEAAMGTITDESGNVLVETKIYGTTLLKGSFGSGSVSIIGGVMVAILICEDYVGDTIKNVYSKGYSRDNVFFAKFISGLVAFMIMVLSGMILSFLAGSFLFDGVGQVGENFVGSLFAIIFLAMAYYVIFFGVSILMKKLSSAIAINIVGPLGITLVFTLVDSLLKIKDFKISEVWIDTRLTQMASVNVVTSDMIGAFIISLIVIAAMGAVSYLVNHKRDN